MTTIDALGDFPISVIDTSRGDKKYSNQSGGYACRHPEAIGQRMGFASPLPYLEAVNDILGNYFCGPKWNGWCCDGIDEETAQFVENVFDCVIGGVKVDRERFKDSHEAWVYAKWGDRSVVLCWENSD